MGCYHKSLRSLRSLLLKAPESVFMEPVSRHIIEPTAGYIDMDMDYETETEDIPTVYLRFTVYGGVIF